MKKLSNYISIVQKTKVPLKKQRDNFRTGVYLFMHAVSSCVLL